MARASGCNNQLFIPRTPSAGTVLLEYVGEVISANRELCRGQEQLPLAIQEQLPPAILPLKEAYSAVVRSYKPGAKRCEPPYCNVSWRVLRGLEAAINQECAKLLF